MPLSQIPAQPRETPPDPATRFRRYYYLVLGKSWLVLLIVAVGVGGAWAWLQRQPFVYSSTATIFVEQAEPRVVKMDKVGNDNPESAEFVFTAVQMLGTKELMLRVANSLSANKGFDPGSRRPDGSPLSVEEIADVIGKKVKAKLRRPTRLIDLTVEDTDPKRAQMIAEAVSTEFLKQSYEQNANLSRAANEFLFQEAARLKEKLEKSEEKLQRYREENQAVSLEDRQNIIVDKLKEINSQAAQAKQDRLRLESDLEQIRRINPSNTEELMRIESVAKLPQVAEIRFHIVRGESEVAVLRQRYLPEHPKYVQAVSQIGNLKQSLAAAVAKAGDSVERRYEAAVETEQKLDAALKEQEKLALDLNKISIPYNVLAREVASDQSTYDAVMLRLRETTVTQSLNRTPFRIVEQPRVAKEPIKPNRIKTMLMAFLLSLAGGIGVAIALDSIDPSFRSLDEVEKRLNLPVIATIPDATALKSRNLLVSHPESRQAEAFRTLATALSLIGPEENRRTFLVTSAVPCEGKTFNAIHCATAFAQSGFRTLLIDGDLRRPQLHSSLLDGESEPVGLSDFLSELVSLKQAVWRTGVENLDLIPAGRHCPQPTMVLSNTAFSALIELSLGDYDRVIVDSAPVNAVSDSLLLAKYFNGVCLVIETGKTPRTAVERAVRLLEQSGANIVGTILNRVRSGYGADYYYYYYGSGYRRAAGYATTRG